MPQASLSVMYRLAGFPSNIFLTFFVREFLQIFFLFCLASLIYFSIYLFMCYLIF